MSIRGSGERTVEMVSVDAISTMETCMRDSGSEVSAMVKAKLFCRVVSDMWVCGRVTGDMVREHSGVQTVPCM